MKLAEALILRADLQKRAAQLEERLLGNLLVQEGEAPSENPNALLKEWEEVNRALTALLPLIHRTNLQTLLPNGETLTDAIVHRDSLDRQMNLLRRAAKGASERFNRYSSSELKMVPTVQAGELQKRADDLARQRRELDTLIQQTNWLTDLLSL